MILYTEEERAADDEFVVNCEWMRNLTQSQLSIASEYQKSYATTKQISQQFNSRLAMKNNMIHPELPYYEAILCFHRARNVYVPNDMLYCFIEGLRLINSAASQYKYKNDIIEYELVKSKQVSEHDAVHAALNTIDEEKTQMDGYQHGHGDVVDVNDFHPVNGRRGRKDDEMSEVLRRHGSISSSPVQQQNVQLSADDLFPILVWIIVHCRIRDIHMRLGYLQQFLDDSIKFFGEVGMCLSLVQAAAEFVRKKEGWHFGLDDQLDRDQLRVDNANHDDNEQNGGADRQLHGQAEKHVEEDNNDKQEIEM